ncbi:Integrase core domain [Popillia japonica]|uniref:Integrase core domain n=1 Tax=Popillia japonica TaxID=7064 RepID=A0AAW1MFJ3_POPJA
MKLCFSISIVVLTLQVVEQISALEQVQITMNRWTDHIHNSLFKMSETITRRTQAEESFKEAYVSQEDGQTMLQEIARNIRKMMTEKVDAVKFAVTFIDDYSRYGETYLLQRKSEVFEKFKQYRAYVENRFNLRIQALRTDRGGEYMSKEFEELLKREGIQRQLTIPGTSQQNGVSERRNLTLANVTRCLLIESGLPLSFWGEAITTATYVRNRCPTIANKGVTPYERFYGVNPDISHLRTFGCRAWYKIKQPKTKFEPRAEEGIMVGYSSESKAYRIYDPRTRKIILARDVVFDENIFPAQNWNRYTYEKPKEWAKIYIEAQEELIDEPITADTQEELIDEPITADIPNEAIHENSENSCENLVHDIVDIAEESEGENFETEETEHTEMNNQFFSSRSGRRIIPPAWSKDYVFDPKTNKAKTTGCRQRDPQNIRQAARSSKYSRSDASTRQREMERSNRRRIRKLNEK